MGPGQEGAWTSHRELWWKAPEDCSEVQRLHSLEHVSLPCQDPVFSSFFLDKDFIYLFMRDTEREAEAQAEGEVGSIQGAQHGTRSQHLGSGPKPKADAQLLNHPGVPLSSHLK